MTTLSGILDSYEASIRQDKPIPALLGAFIAGVYQTTVASNPALTYIRFLDNTASTAKHRNRVDLTSADQSIPIAVYYDEYDELSVWGLEPKQAGASLQVNPVVGPGGIKTIVAGSNITVDNTDPVNPIVASSGGGGTGDYILLRDEQAQNTGGGTFTNGAWRTRPINTEVTDTGNHVSLSSNQITADAGTYRVYIQCPGYAVNAHQSRLYDITNSAVILIGTTAYANGASNGFDRSMLIGRFTLAGTTVLEVQHQCQTTQATFGFGPPANFTTEVYCVVEMIFE